MTSDRISGRFPQHQLRRVLTRVAIMLTVSSVVAITTPHAAAQPLPEGDLATAVGRFFGAPDLTDGANDFSCKPTTKHPSPVILMSGTFVNHGANFVKLGPRLKNAGYCTFALNYGQTAISAWRVNGLDHIENSAAQLDSFVKRVLAATQAEKVSFVGHSQGGNVPLWWIKKMGGADRTDKYVGWAQSGGGTTVMGLATLVKNLGLLGFATDVGNLFAFPGVADQTAYSSYTKTLFPDRNNRSVPDGPSYTSILTEFDEVVTPYTSGTLVGNRVENVVLQQRCPENSTGHIGLAMDEPTLELTLNALAGGPTDLQPLCTGFGIALI